MSHKNITFRKSEYVVLRNLENVFSDKQYTVVQGLYKKVFGPVTNLEMYFQINNTRLYRDYTRKYLVR